MGVRSKIWLLALLLAFVSCSYHHFSKSRFLKECDIHPEQMSLSPQKEKEEVERIFRSDGKQELLELFQTYHKTSDCKEILRNYGEGRFLWEFGRERDSLMTDHLLSWAIRHSQNPEEIVHYVLIYADRQQPERKIAIMRACSDYVDFVSDSLARVVLWHWDEALHRLEDVDYQEVFSVRQRSLKYTMSLYGTESDVFLSNLSACAHSALYADLPDWTMWADSLYRYHKERTIHYKDGCIASLNGDPLYARFKQAVIDGDLDYARELHTYLTNAVHPIPWEKYKYHSADTDRYISSALMLLSFQYYVCDEEQETFWLEEIGATINQFIGPPGYGSSLIECLYPYYEMHPDIAMLLSVYYCQRDLVKVYDMALKAKGFTDNFSAYLLRMTGEYGAPELKNYVDSTRLAVGKNTLKKGENPLLLWAEHWKREKDVSVRNESELNRLYDAHPFIIPRQEDVRSALGPNEVAIEFVQVLPKPFTNPYYVGVMLSPDKTDLTVLGFIDEKQELDQAIQLDNKYRPESFFAYAADVLAPYLEGKTVYFSSTGLLDLVNVAALCCKDGRRLQDICHFVPVYSTKSLCEKKHTGPYSSIALFNGSPDLMGARREVEQIEKMARNASVETVAYHPVSALCNSLLQLSRKSPQIIHIAAHGVYHGPKEDSKGYLAGIWENCGLRFTDGMLSAMDIARMNLVGTDLVVLSACNSGLGELSNEGLTGLRRAFRRAGVKSLLMTLDRVDDEASRFFMEVFYHHLFSGKTKREAFEEAVEAMRRSERYSAPEYWAPFILVE